MTSREFQLPEAFRDTDNLPSLPSVALEVLRLAKDQNANIQDLVQAVSADPVMSVKILKLANSPQHRRDREIASLPQAAVVLGMKTVKLLALSFSLASSLPRGGKNERFDFAEYWRHSLTTAVAAQALARLVKVPYGDEAFLGGLLLRIGQLVMATTISDEYVAVIEQSEFRLPTADGERTILGYDYHLVGQSLLSSWGLPRLLTESVAASGDGSTLDADDDIKTLCRLLRIGDSVASLVGETAEKGELLKQLHELAANYFGLAGQEVDELVVNLQEKVRETAAALSVDLTSEIDFATIMEEARVQMLQLSLDAVADLSLAEARARDLDRASRTDKLTSLPNRAHFDSHLQNVIDARLNGAGRHALGILMIDVDDFKLFNDRFGHAAGDEVLSAVAECLASNTRGTDFTARYGGEEFVMILPNTTLPDLTSVAERLRNAVEDRIVMYRGTAVSLTISVGGACVFDVETNDDGIALLDLADQCLYRAKDAGRNRSVCREVKLAHV